MITGLKGLAADGHEINCRTCRSGKTCNVANAHGYWVGACVEYSPEKPMTNADRIRAMTNEELAEWIYQETTNALNLLSFGNGKPSKSFFTWLDWLKQEVESDA